MDRQEFEEDLLAPGGLERLEQRLMRLSRDAAPQSSSGATARRRLPPEAQPQDVETELTRREREGLSEDRR